MNVLLSPELERFVSEKISAGRYASVSEMVSNALQLLREQEALTPEYEEWVRKEVLRGVDQLNRGETSDVEIETIIAQERQRMAERKGRN